MSRSKKWKLEWSFFIDADGRRKYNDLCRRCIHDCKQSFRSSVIECSRYQSKRAEGSKSVTIRVE
jgi:hypothetical protein